MVSAVSGLGNHESDRVGRDDWIAVSPLACVIHFDGDPRQALNHELASLGRMPTGAASRDVDLLRGLEFGFRDFHLVEEDVTCLLRDPSQRRVAHRTRLLINLFEHEMLEPAFFRHDRVPGDVLDLTNYGLSVEVGETNPLGCDHGEVAIGKEKQVARVIQDRGHVGGYKIFIFAKSDDRGRAVAGCHNLIWLIN